MDEERQVENVEEGEEERMEEEASEGVAGGAIEYDFYNEAEDRLVAHKGSFFCLSV